MTTISISLDEETKQDIDRMAKAAKVSRSDIVRNMFTLYRLDKSLEKLQDAAAPKLRALEIETEQELYDYLESTQTYEDRIRQQRLPGRNKAK
ncbi:MAG TPA: ribbon-helix-helix protein, CopG family [Candidatus Saccharimonadales bacterium]|nr:ribbon-helix-helix protein, CopG family [Candidatus Saccharimonadales bacterium]